MPAPLTPSAGKTHAFNRPSTRAHESPSPAVEPQHCSPSHPNVSPLRNHHYHLSSSASSSAGVAGRHGCVLPSHHSFVSLTHPSQGNGGVGAGGTHGGHSATLSLASTEMQEYLSMASPASDFYYYSPQQHYYLEPSMPYAAAELYGRGSPCLNSFSASTPSRVSNLSLSGPRFPQWYLPRGMYASSSAFLPSGGPIPSSVLYGSPSPYHHATSAAASVSADEDAMSCENGGGGSVAVVSRQPPVQRLTPQPSASAVTAFALPPAMASMERGSSAATPPHSPRYAAGQTPHFVSFDGRAYGLPVYGFYSTPDSAAGQQQQQQLVPPRGDATAASGSDGGANGSSRRGPLRRLEVVAEVPVTALPSRGRPGQAADAAAAMDGGAEGDKEDVYSPQEKALLVDAHARLARLRSKALDEEQQQRVLAAYSAPSSPTAASTHAEESSAARRRQRLSRKAGAAAAAQRSASAQSTVDDGEIPISPIPPLVGADSADVTRLDDSMADAEEDTRAVLERVLSVPGVKWRHDPYSRRVLPARPSSGSSISESDGGDGQRQRAPQLGSEPSSPDAAAQRSASIRTRPVSAAARQAPFSTSASTSAGSSVLSAHERSGVTQPPGGSSTPSQTRLSGRDDSVSSAKAPQQQQQQSRLAQHSDSEAERQKQPSARRVPIKKVCVRHFVSGHGDSTSSTDAAVGLLTTVITPASAVSREVAQAASHETSARSTTSASLSASSCVERESPAGTAAEAAQRSVRSADRVPQPRSKAKQLSEAAAAAPHVVTTVSSSSSSNSSSNNQPEQSAPHTYVDATAPSAVAAVPLWRTAQHLPSPFGSSSSVTPTAAAAALSWARRLRTPAEDAVAGQHAEHGGMRSQEAAAAARLRGAAASTDDLDTSDLVRMWQRLGAAGYFRDVLAAREWKLGADSNSSTRAVGRNGARRSGSRQHQQGGARGGESPNKLQMAMLTEREVTHVYVLRHRYRTSCAVAASLFEPGTAVVVDGDMGVDTGVVALAITRAEFDALTPRERSLAGLAMQLSHAMMATIHRQALPEEMSLRTSVQMPLEDATLDFVRFLCTQPHLFSSCQIDLMEFVSVEFQADGQKLYVHYKAHASVRFLELATYLNHIFHCRIWMKLARDTWEA